MKAAITKKQIESVLADRFGNIFEQQGRTAVEVLSTGIVELDKVLHGFPRGAITEIHGTSSSGRSSVMLATLAAATIQEEICAIIDCNDTFDLSSAANAGVDFNRVLWVRCKHDFERAFKAVDLILHSGGFGLVVLNLADVAPRLVRRIISSWWFRFRRAIENTPTALLVITPIAAVRSCATLALELERKESVWPSTLSLVSENPNGHFTNQTERHDRLSLVTTRRSSDDLRLHSHTNFLQSARIQVNRQRSVEWQPEALTFFSQRHSSTCQFR